MERGDRDCLRNAMDKFLDCSAKGIQWPGMNKEQREAFDHVIVFCVDKDVLETLDKLARELSMHYAAKIFLLIDALRVAAESHMGPESIVVQSETVRTRSLSSHVCKRLQSLSASASSNGSPGTVMNNYLEVIQTISMTGDQIRYLTIEQRQLYAHMKNISSTPANESPYGVGTQFSSSLPDVQGNLIYFPRGQDRPREIP